MSSKKPFDHIEDKIKQAAENNLPVFDEKAWQAMEEKLDKDKKKRRPLIWWFILPLLLAGGWAIYNKYDGKTDETQTAAVTNTGNKNNNGNKQESTSKNLAADTPEDGELVSTTVTGREVTNADRKTIDVKINQQQPAANSFLQDVVTSGNNTSSLYKNKKIVGKKKGKIKSTVTGAEADEITNTTITGDYNLPQKDVAVNELELEKVAKETAPVVTPEQKSETLAQETKTVERLTEKKVEEKDATPAEKMRQKKKQKDNGLYLLAAGGADAGSTKLLSFANSSITPKYGVGIGYRFNKRWSVQTGFYANNKKYVAGAADYKFKPGSPMTAYTIDKIKAACLVYEIPVTVRYDIVSRPSFILYVTGSAESYIIQKEKYNCSYWYYNNIYEQEWKYSGNRHLFSTAMFSVGIEKPLSSKFSLLAEPSVSIPLSGVGDGKMNIYSAAALLGIKYYPFKK